MASQPKKTFAEVKRWPITADNSGADRLEEPLPAETVSEVPSV